VSHMVIFQTPDGNPGYNQFETIEEAVRFVEVLRNEQSVENARMFALEEVRFDFKPYYRVEIDPPMLNPGPSQPAPVQSAPQQQAAPAPAPSQQPPRPPAPPAPPSGEGPSNGFKPVDSPSSPPPPAPPSAPTAGGNGQPQQEGSPVGNEAPVSTVPPPTFMAGASEREEQPATTRRGLFGR